MAKKAARKKTRPAQKKKKAAKKKAAKKRTTKSAKSRRGQDGRTVTDAQIADAIRESRGMLSVAARHLGVSDRALRYRLAKSEELERVRYEAREANKDLAESALLKAIEKGEAWAVCFYLKCQARDRGYMERIDVQQDSHVHHSGNVDIRAVVAELEAHPAFVDFARRRVQDSNAGLLRSGSKPADGEAQ